MSDEVIDVVELSVEEFVDILELCRWEHGIESMCITECFDNYKSTSYVVDNLIMDVNSNFCCCTDERCVILNRKSILMMFLQTSLLLIQKVKTEIMTYVELLFADGMIKIEKYV